MASTAVAKIDLAVDLVVMFRDWMVMKGQPRAPLTRGRYVKEVEQLMSFYVKNDPTFHPSQLVNMDGDGPIPRLPLFSIYAGQKAVTSLNMTVNAYKVS